MTGCGHAGEPCCEGLDEVQYDSGLGPEVIKYSYFCLSQVYGELMCLEDGDDLVCKTEATAQGCGHANEPPCHSIVSRGETGMGYGYRCFPGFEVLSDDDGSRLCVPRE
jgi:hypothetical protein